MKNLAIKIDRNAIMQEVSLASAYAGAKSGNEEEASFDRVALVESDAALITRFWYETAGVICGKLQPLILASSLDDESLEMELRLSGSYDESLNDSVKADIFSCFSSGVTARWFRYSYPARAGEWEEESLELLGRAFRKLCHRLPPARKNPLTN